MKLDDLFPLIYCINLERRPDRWKESVRQFIKVGLFPQRFKAIENEFPPMGCLKSHITILKEALNQKKSVFIFEDDVQFSDQYDPIVSLALQELPQDFAMFYLGGNILKPFYQTTNHLAKLTHCQSTHAYGINIRYLAEIVNFLEYQNFYIDMLYANNIIPALPCYITVPMIATQREDFSDIENQKVNYDYTWERYRSNFVQRTG